MSIILKGFMNPVNSQTIITLFYNAGAAQPRTISASFPAGHNQHRIA